jgi:hypothetical protein
MPNPLFYGIFDIILRVRLPDVSNINICGAGEAHEHFCLKFVGVIINY